MVVIGGTRLLSAVLLFSTRESALQWSAVAGFKILVWIISELGFIHAFNWAQTIYVVSGLLLLVLVVALLGVVPGRPPGSDKLPGCTATRGTVTDDTMP